MCCGSSRAIRSVQVPSKQSTRATQPKVIVQKVNRSNNRTQAVNINRQYVIPRKTCPKCQKPTMLVYIAGRERDQCTNNDCRHILT